MTTLFVFVFAERVSMNSLRSNAVRIEVIKEKKNTYVKNNDIVFGLKQKEKGRDIQDSFTLWLT